MIVQKQIKIDARRKDYPQICVDFFILLLSHLNILSFNQVDCERMFFYIFFTKLKV